MVTADQVRETVDLATALSVLATWYHENKVQFVWSHGENFDIPILQNAYKVMGINSPWQYWTARDTRTLFHIAGMERADLPPNPNPHDALADAEWTAALVCEAWKNITAYP